jgi:DNA replication protein DnaC
MSLYAEDANEEWAAARRHHLYNLVRKQRPQRLTAKGELHDDVADWVGRLLEWNDPTSPDAPLPGNLLLGGPIGCGKTWTAWEVIEKGALAGFDGSWLFATSADWQDTVAPPVDRERLRKMRSVDLLILDDFGSGRINEWQRECLLGVVDERWANARPIIVTFNAESLRDMVGERIASRLAHGVTTVAFEGDDRRRNS